jgi:uncharacterized protein YndB with AHSA1/START domain
MSQKIIPLPYRIEPVRKSISVPVPPPRAFELFTAKLNQWWPREQFSCFAQESADCGFEPKVGGELWETARDGRRATWGTILSWDPPHGFAMTWHPDRDASSAQRLELTFRPHNDGTLVELKHSGWELLAEQATPTRDGYDGGWDFVFVKCFGEACS